MKKRLLVDSMAQNLIFRRIVAFDWGHKKNSESPNNWTYRCDHDFLAHDAIFDPQLLLELFAQFREAQPVSIRV